MCNHSVAKKDKFAIKFFHKRQSMLLSIHIYILKRTRYVSFVSMYMWNKCRTVPYHDGRTCKLAWYEATKSIYPIIQKPMAISKQTQLLLKNK